MDRPVITIEPKITNGDHVLDVVAAAHGMKEALLASWPEAPV